VSMAGTRKGSHRAVARNRGKSTVARARGRPRTFDVDDALDRAMRLFWRKGYLGTSLSDLTTTMGINKPSLYAAFGGKEQLFRRALERYAAGPSAYLRDALTQPTSRQVVEHMLRGAATVGTDPSNPPGCMWVRASLTSGDSKDPLSRELAAAARAGHAGLRKRFEKAIAIGDLPGDANASDLAHYVMTVSQGLSVRAAAGARRQDLLRVVAEVLRNWPSGTNRSISAP
jgi:AcrR family transcriptional regulator